jgi:hypothetical protein
MIPPTGADGGSGNGNTPLPLLFHPVGYGRAFMDLPNFVNNARVVQNSFSGSSLTRVNVGSNTNVSNLFKGNCADHIDLLITP